MNVLTGLSAFPITPASDEGIVDIEVLKNLVARLCAAQVDSIGVLGSTGSYPYLARSERRRVIQSVVAQAGNIPVMAGIGALRTDEVLALGRDAQEAGVAAVLLAPVSYAPLTDREVFTLFQTVADALEVPVCIYNNPGTTHFTFSNPLIARLSALPRIIGAKNPALDSGVSQQLAELRRNVPVEFSLGYSRDWNALDALIAGGDAWYSVAAGLWPDVCLRMVRAVQSGNTELARSLDERLQPLWALFQELSSLRVCYAAASILGLAHCSPPLPILPLTDADQRRVAAVIDALGLE